MQTIAERMSRVEMRVGFLESRDDLKRLHPEGANTGVGALGTQRVLARPRRALRDRGQQWPRARALPTRPTSAGAGHGGGGDVKAGRAPRGRGLSREAGAARDRGRSGGARGAERGAARKAGEERPGRRAAAGEGAAAGRKQNS